MSKKFITELVLSNYKKHRHYSAKINGKHFIVAGPNGAGKSSILYAINRLLLRSQPKLANTVLPDDTPEMPITKGEEKGSIKICLTEDQTEYTVEERYTKAGKARITFTRHNSDGTKAVLTPAQDSIKHIFGNCVDLSPLMDLSGLKQFEYLQKAFDIDISGYKTQRQNLVEDRKFLNRDIKTLEAKLNDPEYHIYDADIEAYSATVDVAKLQDSYIDTNLINAEIDLAQKANAARKNIIDKLDETKRQIAELLKIQTQLEEQLKLSQVKDLTPLKLKLEEANKENAEIDKKIASASDHNLMVQKVKNFLASKTDLEKKKTDADDKNKTIAKLDKDLKDGLAAIKFSEIYPGLELRYSLDEDGDLLDSGLYLNEMPFHRSQQSHGEMIKVLIKLSIFINPDGLNFVSIGDWNILDKNNQDELLQFAKENENVQLGIEKVENSEQIITEFIEL